MSFCVLVGPCISFLKKCLFGYFSHFFMGPFVFLLSCKSSLYILVTSPRRASNVSVSSAGPGWSLVRHPRGPLPAPPSRPLLETEACAGSSGEGSEEASGPPGTSGPADLGRQSEQSRVGLSSDTCLGRGDPYLWLLTPHPSPFHRWRLQNPGAVHRRASKPDLDPGSHQRASK